MFNSKLPDMSELPTTRQLVGSTFLAMGGAAAILVAVVMPSEYGIDPTGLGGVLGLTEMGEMPFRGQMCPVVKMTFADGVGDSPDDWYLLYTSPQSGRLIAMAYIVTYGKTAEAEPQPHAIVYERFVMSDGALISTEWTFYNWSERQGIYGDPIGRAILRNLMFFKKVEKGAFDPPAESKIDPLP